MELTLKDTIKAYLEEDGCKQDLRYFTSLPTTPSQATLFIKSDLILSGLPFFLAVFEELTPLSLEWKKLLQYEGKAFQKGSKIEFPGTLPWNVLITAERVALNLLQRSSAIATMTSALVEKTRPHNIKILDTRKTTPGLRYLEKYSVLQGGGYNHRYSQTDGWMIKDNHKTHFGSLTRAVEFFVGQRQFYKPIIVEIHSIEELKEAVALNLSHLLLDNFTTEMIKEAVKIKKPGMTYEISGGIRPENIDTFCIPGVDALSVGVLTQFPNSVDISLKFKDKT